MFKHIRDNVVCRTSKFVYLQNLRPLQIHVIENSFIGRYNSHISALINNFSLNNISCKNVLKSELNYSKIFDGFSFNILTRWLPQSSILYTAWLLGWNASCRSFVLNCKGHLQDYSGFKSTTAVVVTLKMTIEDETSASYSSWTRFKSKN